MTNSTITAPEIAENGDNSPGGSLKSEIPLSGGVDKSQETRWQNGKDIPEGESLTAHTSGSEISRTQTSGSSEPPAQNSLGAPETHNVNQYMTARIACEKLVNKPSELFPSLLQSAEDERREQLNSRG